MTKDIKKGKVGVLNIVGRQHLDSFGHMENF